MDYTIIPRYLIYKQRETLGEFEQDAIGELNQNIYRLLRRHLYAELGFNNYSTIIKSLMNEAYYLCTLFLMDENSEAHFREYIEVILQYSKYPEDIKRRLRNMVYALAYVYLGLIAATEHNVRNIRRHLRNYSYEYMVLFSETAELKHPDASLFQPVVLTDALLGKANWATLTHGYEANYVVFFLQALGNSPEEKRMLIRDIYTRIVSSGNMSKVSYQVDSLLFNYYEKFGGRRDELLNLSQRSMERDTKSELMERINRLEEEKMTLLKKMQQVETKNKMLMQELNVTQKQITNLNQEKIVIERDKQVQQRREEEMKMKLKEMDLKVQTFQDKLGAKTVKLSSLVEGLKRYTRFRGIDAGKDVFLSLNYLLLKEAVWVDNVEDLENFFVEYETESNSPLLTLENNQGGIIQISKKDKE